MGRINNAITEYENRNWKVNEGAFYPRDIDEIAEAANGDMAKAIMMALEAAYMIGYRKGRKR